MTDFLFNIFAFIVALGVLITIHEFGHFWVARKSGVRVLRFSIGFGKPLLQKIGKDGTEYILAAIPLGGYVKMLDEREGNVPADQLDQAFNNKSVWTRIAIVAAGPIANFILAVIAYWAMFVIGISGVLPLVGGVEEQSAAARAGFQYEDQIIAVGDAQTRSWNEVRLALVDKSMAKADFIDIKVKDQNGNTANRSLVVDSDGLLNGKGDVIGELGIKHWWPDVSPVIGGVSPDGAAKESGLIAGDEILLANGQEVKNWRVWVELIRANPEKTIELLIERDGQRQTLDLRPKVKVLDAGETRIGFIGAWETQSAELLKRIRVVVSYGPLEAISAAAERTWNMSVLTVQMMGKLIVGEASIENISGPITIAKIAGQSASVGIDHYLSFLALISISLGVLNLLPVPVLDGGHLLYFFVEVVTGKPLSDKVQMFGQQIGMVLLAGLMSIAFYNDIVRLIG